MNISAMKTRDFVCAVSVALLLGACTSGSGASDEAPTGSNAQTTSDSAEPSSSTSAEPDDATAKFGQTFTWEDHLSVTVGKPVKFKASEYAAVEGKGTDLKLKITLINKTGKTFDPNLFSTSVQSSDKEAEEVFDTESGLEGAPSTKILNGRQSTFYIGYRVADPKDIVMDVNPDFDHEAATFTN